MDQGTYIISFHGCTENRLGIVNSGLFLKTTWLFLNSIVNFRVEKAKDYDLLSPSPYGSPHVHRKLSWRKTWYSDQLVQDQFTPPENSQRDDYKESNTPSPVSPVSSISPVSPRTRIPQRSSTFSSGDSRKSSISMIVESPKEEEGRQVEMYSDRRSGSYHPARRGVRRSESTTPASRSGIVKQGIPVRKSQSWYIPSINGKEIIEKTQKKIHETPEKEQDAVDGMILFEYTLRSEINAMP